MNALAIVPIDEATHVECIEDLDRESQRWVDPAVLEGKALAKGIEIVMRDTGFDAFTIAGLLGVGKATIYRWRRAAERLPRYQLRALWEMLAEIRERYGR